MKPCYLINRGNNSSLYISPFADPSSSHGWDENEEITIFSATTVTKEQKDGVFFTLYTDIDRGVDRWIQDVRYLPRLLIAGAIFLITYFFFSLAVRDPIPLVDEFIIASAVTFISVIGLSRRDKRSDLSIKKRFELKQKASECDYQVVPELELIEQYIHECSQLETIELAEKIAKVDGATLPPLVLDMDVLYMKSFKEQYLTFIRLQHKDIYSLYNKYLKVMKNQKNRDAFSARLLRIGMNQISDIPLLALTIMIANQ
jgi:hypothetical protein